MPTNAWCWNYHGKLLERPVPCRMRSPEVPRRLIPKAKKVVFEKYA